MTIIPTIFYDCNVFLILLSTIPTSSDSNEKPIFELM